MPLRRDIQAARKRMLNAQEALLLDAFAGSRDPEVQESLVAEMDQERAAFLELIARVDKQPSSGNHVIPHGIARLLSFWHPSRLGGRQGLKATIQPMQREYELFEQLHDGSVMWRGHAAGVPEVRQKLSELSKTTVNECFAIHLPTKEIVAYVNVGGSRPKIEKQLVAQIAYDHSLAMKRTDLLRARGYAVVTVIGNEAAKLVLDLSPSWNFFIVSDAAATEVREEIVDWLKSRFPAVPVLALNPLETSELLGADYNANQNEPEMWLPIIGYGVLVRREARDMRPMS